MPKLFDDVGKFTPEGMNFLHEVSQAIKPILIKYHEQGFLAREIGHAASFAVHDSENIMCLQDMHKQFKKEKENVPSK